MRYSVKLDCRSGVSRLVGDAWEQVYHVITWFHTDSLQEATEAALRQVRWNPRETRQAWVNQHEAGQETTVFMACR